MVNTYLLSNSDIDFLLNQSEVISAKQNIDKLSSGSIYFTINLNDTVRQSLLNKLGLNLKIYLCIYSPNATFCLFNV